MKAFKIRMGKLFIGLFLYALGIAVTMKANLGYASWEVFHQGIARTTGISIGLASIITGLIICIVVVMMGEKLGLGTILNMLMIGLFLDIILSLDFIPLMSGLISGILMMVSGLFLIAFATYFYIDSAFGAGPRDSLMVAIERKTGLPVGMSRGIVEVTAVSIGWLLGGPVGLGTLIAAVVIGFCIQIVFTLMKFEATKIKHETLGVTIKNSGRYRSW